jgi:iron complex outermembrane receptor protein
MNTLKKDPTMMKTFAKVALSAAVASVSVTAAGQALEEVVVTAQKRTESLQDVPISVTANLRRTGSGRFD